MVTIGSDIHLKTSTMTVLDSNGQKIMQTKLDNHPDILREFVEQFSGPKQFAMEANYNWPAFYELLNPCVDEFHLLHAKKLESIIDSQSKCDIHDADEIAHLTHIGYIPKAHTANIHTRQLRRLVRTRVQVAQYAASLKNKIHAIINANTFYSQRPQNFKDLFCKRGLLYLKDLSLPTQERFVVDQLLNHIQYLQRLKQSIEQQIQTIDLSPHRAQHLTTVPGMKGKVFRYIVLAEIDHIERFKNPDRLIAYAGLAPRDKSSGGKLRKGHLRTDCNHYLQWAMIESTMIALRQDPGLRQYYKELKQRLNPSAARIKIARKLLKAIYYVLKEQRPYYLFATADSSRLSFTISS